MMDTEAVLMFIELSQRANIDVCLDGGWGVDALLSEQTREHADLDIIIRVEDVPRLREVFESAGYRVKPDGSPTNFVMRDDAGHEVDVHAIAFDKRGYGVFPVPDGRQWPFPPSAFAGQGTIAGREVRCLSAEAQVQCHGQGYTPTENDLADMECLQQRFDVVLPLILCRQPHMS
ncbi:MAG: nucleotidyltransferase family protein [Planctomycetaceae bacterium]|nr:nucleotidyltransferase family protein [Planctomycetaceae bacterium]